MVLLALKNLYIGYDYKKHSWNEIMFGNPAFNSQKMSYTFRELAECPEMNDPLHNLNPFKLLISCPNQRLLLYVKNSIAYNQVLWCRMHGEFLNFVEIHFAKLLIFP